MCRFALYLGPPIRLSTLVTEPANSIIHQSFDSQEGSETLNGDGFGVAWYVPELEPEPAVFREISPAWNNQNLFNLAPVSVSGCLLAHVRAATPGSAVMRLNCHPFSRGRLAFMHNGHVGGFDRLRRRLRESLTDEAYHAIEGTTDSEHVFAVLTDLLENGAARAGAERLAAALVGAIDRVEGLRTESGIEEMSFLNLAVTDGECAAASRYVSDGSDAALSLYVVTGHLKVERGEAVVVPEGQGEPAAIVASEPLGDRDRWRRVPPNHLVLIDAKRTVEVRPIARKSGARASVPHEKGDPVARRKPGAVS